jgi:hypothetical protein
MTLTLTAFGLEVEPPKKRKVIGIYAHWPDVVHACELQREDDPDTPVHIDRLPDGRTMVYIEVPK